MNRFQLPTPKVRPAAPRSRSWDQIKVGEHDGQWTAVPHRRGGLQVSPPSGRVVTPKRLPATVVETADLRVIRSPRMSTDEAALIFHNMAAAAK